MLAGADASSVAATDAAALGDAAADGAALVPAEGAADAAPVGRVVAPGPLQPTTIAATARAAKTVRIINIVLLVVYARVY
jgi:hypothetical protein